MPDNVGTQIVSLIHYSAASSPNVNRRHQDIRQVGLYQGGRLTVVDGPTRAASLSALICEISDGTYQVKVQTTTAISLTAVEATPYIILRWTYVGAASDFMEVLSIAAPLTNDVVIGKANFAAGALTGFTYGDATYPRSTPNTQDLFLKVEPTEDAELKVRIRAGRITGYTESIDVIDQKSSLFTVPTANSRIDLVYLNKDTGAVSIDASGTEAASPVAPDYAGKLVLAEVTLAAASTNIIASMIKDVRNWIALPQSVDDTTIEKSATGELQVKSTGVGLQLRTGTLAAYDFTEVDITQDGAWHDLDLSSIVPVGTKAVTLSIGLYTYADIAETIYFRKKGVLDSVNIARADNTILGRGQVSDVLVGVNSDRKIQYYVTHSVQAIGSIQIVIRAWYL